MAKGVFNHEILLRTTMRSIDGVNIDNSLVYYTDDSMFGIKRKTYSYEESIRKGIITDHYTDMEKTLLWAHHIDPA